MEDKMNTIENLEEEMRRIQEEIERKKKKVEAVEKTISPERQKEIISEAVQEHIEKYPPETLGEGYKISEKEKMKHIGDLEPEEDDSKIDQLLEIAKEKGVVNAFEICKKLSPHLQDDFHRRLVHWLNFEM